MYGKSYVTHHDKLSLKALFEHSTMTTFVMVGHLNDMQLAIKG